MYKEKGATPIKVPPTDLVPPLKKEQWFFFSDI